MVPSVVELSDPVLKDFAFAAFESVGTGCDAKVT